MIMCALPTERRIGCQRPAIGDLCRAFNFRTTPARASFERPSAIAALVCRGAAFLFLCYRWRMGLTVEQATKVAQRIWLRAAHLPDRANRVKALQRARLIVQLAQARERLNAERTKPPSLSS